MKMRFASLSVLTLCCVMLAVIPAMAGYSSGPPGLDGGQVLINSGNSVSDSYTLFGPPVSTLNFVYWDPSTSDLLTAVDVAFGTGPFGGIPVPYPLASNTFLTTNKFGYSVFDATVSLRPPFPTGAGWLTLSNACTTSGCSIATAIGWDECMPGPGCAGEAFTLFDRGSPSTYEGAMTSIPAESFTLAGPSGTTPEPSSIMLFSSGILGLAGVLRRRLNS